MAILRLGSKIICPIKFSLPSSVSLYITPSIQQQQIIPEEGYCTKIKLSGVTSAVDSNIIPENIKKNVNILGVTGTYKVTTPIYRIQYKIDNNKLNKKGIFLDTHGIRNLSDYVLYDSYYYVTFENSRVIFYDLEYMSGQSSLAYCFSRAIGLTDIYFPSLLPMAFGSYTDQFHNMLSMVSNCTVHFPVTLEHIIKNWTDVINGFGNTTTTIVYDLPGHVRDTSTDLVYDPNTDSYIPVTNA